MPVGLPGAEGPPGPQGPAGINATFYAIPAGHDGWVPGTGSANMVIQGQDLTAINSNSIVRTGCERSKTLPVHRKNYHNYQDIF